MKKPFLKKKSDKPFDACMYAGKCYLELKEYEQAEDILQYAKARKPTDPRLMNALISLYSFYKKEHASEYIDRQCEILEK